MKNKVLTIGPPEARAMLGGNTHNRNVSPKVVARYAREMKAGRWRLNGIAISLMGQNGNQEVVNGQHRLLAVIESDTTQQFWVVWEEAEDVYRTFDTGSNRNLATFIAMDGQPQPVVNGALARMVCYYHRFPDRVWESSLLSGAEVLAWYEEQDRERLMFSVHDFNNARSRLGLLGTWYAAFSWLVRNESPNGERFEEFQQPVWYGNDLGEGDPRLALRNYLITRVPTGGQRRSDDWRRQATLGVGLRAWSEWLEGVTDRQNYKFQAGRVVNGKRIQSSLPMPTIS